jgi:hypothetical protein
MRVPLGTPEFDRSRDERKKVEMRFAHLKTHHRFERMRLRGLSGARDEFRRHRAEPEDPRKTYLAADAVLVRRLRRVTVPRRLRLDASTKAAGPTTKGHALELATAIQNAQMMSHARLVGGLLQHHRSVTAITA